MSSVPFTERTVHSPGCRYIISGSEDHRVYIWNTFNDKQKKGGIFSRSRSDRSDTYESFEGCRGFILHPTLGAVFVFHGRVLCCELVSLTQSPSTIMRCVSAGGWCSLETTAHEHTVTCAKFFPFKVEGTEDEREESSLGMVSPCVSFPPA